MECWGSSSQPAPLPLTPPCPTRVSVLLGIKISCFLSHHCPSWDKPTAWVCPVCFVYNMSKIATLCKSVGKFLALARGGQIQARSWRCDIKVLAGGVGTTSCRKIFPFAAEASAWVLLGEERKEGLLISCTAYWPATLAMGTGRGLLLGERSEGKTLSEPSPFLRSQHAEWVTLLE